jgi:hypothetical protein
MSNLSLLFLSTTSLTLEKTEWGIENGQSRNMDKTKLNKVKNTTQKTKKLSNTMFVDIADTTAPNLIYV